MKIDVANNVIAFINKKGYVGIIIEKEVQSCGWAGPREKIRGEFVKKIEEMENEINRFSIKEVSGIKVFIPKYMDNGIVPHIVVTSLINIFGFSMILSVELLKD